MQKHRSPIAIALFLLAATLSSYSQESVLDALEKPELLTVYGAIDSAIGLAVGWPVGPFHPEFLSSTNLLKGAKVANTLSFDARPDFSFRAHGSFYISSTDYLLTISELFFDYTIGNAIFLRGGKQSLSWGNARIFYEATDIVAGDLIYRIPMDSLSLKLYLPFGGSGFTALASTTKAWASGDLTGPGLSGAIKLDIALGRFEFAEAGTAQYDGTYAFSSTVKTSVAGIDLYAQGYGKYSGGNLSPLSCLAGASWDSSNPRIMVSAEFWHRGESGLSDDNRLAIGAGWKFATPMPTKFALLWAHAFKDNSGVIMPAFIFDPIRHITITLSPLFSYGASGSVYASSLPPGIDIPFSWTDKYAFLLSVALKTEY